MHGTKEQGISYQAAWQMYRDGKLAVAVPTEPHQIQDGGDAGAAAGDGQFGQEDLRQKADLAAGGDRPGRMAQDQVPPPGPSPPIARACGNAWASPSPC